MSQYGVNRQICAVNTCERSLFFNPFMKSEPFYLSFLDKSISSGRGVWVVFIITMFYKNSLYGKIPSKIFSGTAGPICMKRGV